MKKIYVLGTKYIAEKIIKKDNNINLINVVDVDGNILGNLNFPNISNLDDYQLEEEQEWDIEVDEISQLKISQAEQFETILEMLGGIM